MDYTELDGSGLRISRVGLGCNNFGRGVDLEGTCAVVDAALEVGVTLLDSADIYGAEGASERLLGEVLEGRREQAVLVTKAGMDLGEGYTSRGSREYLRFSVERSLGRLRTDWIDLFYLHEPDPSTPIGETLAALDEMVQEGRIRALGCSNFSPAQLREAAAAAKERGVAGFAVVQNEYSLLNRAEEEEMFPTCLELGVGCIPYFPLANGLLTGKYRPGSAPAGSRLEGEEIEAETFERIEALEQFAEERGHTLLELAISGVASQPAVTSVIAGATRPEQIRANAAAGEWQLDAADLAALAQLS